MTTTGEGKTYCDACIEMYFWNSLHWKEDFNQDLARSGTTQCVDCCVLCEDVCDVDNKDDCLACNNSAVLETLDVKRGWSGASVLKMR